MAWSLRTLYLGHQNVGRFDTAEAKNEVSLIRGMMGSAWEMVSGELWWQTLFDAFCADRLRQSDVPETPKKQKKGDSLENEDMELATPPRPDPPCAPGKRKGEPDTTGVETPPRPDAQATSLIEATGKPEGPKRAEGAKPVPMVSKAVNAPQQLMQPQPKCARKFQEPEAPDMEETFHQIMMAPQEKGDMSVLKDANVEDIDDGMLKDYVRDRKRKAHERSCKKKIPTQREVDDRRLNAWLAQKGVTYQTFTTFHRQQAALRKAAACSAGGWKSFKLLLLGEKKQNKEDEKKCDVCKLIMQKWKIPEDEFEVRAAVAEQAEKDTEKEKPADHPDDQEPGEEEENESTEYQRCVKLVQSYAPVIELIETPDGGLMYRCRICITRTQPQGKTNKLPVIKLKSVKTLIDQHVLAPTHTANVEKLQNVGKSGPAVSKECPGYCVNHHPENKLYLYMKELKLWLSYNNMDCDMTQHKYWHIYAGDLLWIRHKDCHTKFLVDKDEKRQCCQACESLTDRKSVQKTLVRFLMKFYAAMLLQKRLFCNESEVASFMEELEGGTFAFNNAVAWKQIHTLRNVNLQAFVRRSWSHIPDVQKTSNIKVFLGTVVDPCLKVHVNTVGSNLTALSSKFVDALCENSQSAPWHNLIAIWHDNA